MKRFCLIILTLMCFSCGKNDGYIPDISVNFSSPLSDPRLSKLSAAGGAVLISGYGICGLIIYRSPVSGYVAYDRCSSYQPEKKCAVVLDDPTLTVTDPCSGAKFSLNDGSPVKAPAVRSLKSYTVNVSNNEIFVSN
jgi:nitrite reductase/ring-hydroxylating ferredoxin subunit